MAGVLRVKVNGVWTDIGTGSNVRSFATVAERDAQWTVAAAAGGFAYITATKTLYFSDGTGWIIMSEPSQSYAPTLTNISFGSGFSHAGNFQRSNGWCTVNVLTNMGATSAGVITAPGPTWTLPAGITAYDPGASSFVVAGGCFLYDANGAIQQLTPFMQTTAKMEPRLLLVSGTAAAALQQVTNTVPITIQAGDFFNLKYHFQMGTPYQ